MQNWSKSAEDKYKACFETYGVGAGLQYPGPIRASLEASEGCVLVDPDFTGAEMAIAAFACQDPNMLECIRRNSLPEDHPDYLDIHSMVAVRAFKLDCEWSKKALKAIGKAHLRTPAKRVGFGKLYGQTPASMARKIREDKVAITDEEAAAVDNAIDEMWPGLPQYMNECRQRAADPGWMQNCYGRSRRRPRGFVSNVALRDLERKFMNFGMQSAVADAMKVTLGNLIWYRAAYRQAHPESPHTFRILLEIHDQLVLETPTGSLDWMIDEVLPLCMSKLVPIRPRRLDGTLIDAGPYYLSVPQPDVYTQWTVPLKPVDCERLGISSRYAKESS
jgi:DNA polymerase I-like protein with 3'-5' exonuclease and polymerase domains